MDDHIWVHGTIFLLSLCGGPTMDLLYDDQNIETCWFDFGDGELTHRKFEVDLDRILLLHPLTLEVLL